MLLICFFFFKQKTAYEMRISDWSSDVCSSDLENTEGGDDMATVRAGLIQMALKADTGDSPQAIRDRMNEAHLPLIDEAGKKGVQVLCLQEVFTQPYFCPSQDAKWSAAAEKVPEGPPVDRKSVV